MIITKKIAESIIEKNKMFAPNKAKVILIHEDGRVIFAEKFEQGCAFWFADTMRESKLQGIIYKLTLVAKRNDKGDWVTVCDFSSKVETKPKTRQERILEAQEKLRVARTSSAEKPEIKPAVMPVTKLPPVSEKSVEQYAEKRKGDGMSVSKMSKTVEPFKPNSAVEVVSAVTEVVSKVREDMIALGALDDPSEFISLRELEPPARRRVANEMFVSFRPDGKIILCKALRDALPWTTLNMMVARDFKRFGVCAGKDYNVNQSGTYVNRAMCSKLTFPEDSGTIRVVVEWDDKLNMYVGDFQ
ncbi:hypothetical protein F416_gp091 [Salmonella typhimurium phage PhiSH19]|uniref:Uncharacterized protein n=1 Tax=Salmonella typhimurium phage PhiSH19 TaxID=1108865 RepID=G8GDL7_9CAUD|nr:hypothetical protein F416_gp091 [Salmonella phage Sh19]AER70223.1 putative uncharacterized protein [Salmonella phage Sh19]